MFPRCQDHMKYIPIEFDRFYRKPMILSPGTQKIRLPKESLYFLPPPSLRTCCKESKCVLQSLPWEKSNNSWGIHMIFSPRPWQNQYFQRNTYVFSSSSFKQTQGKPMSLSPRPQKNISLKRINMSQPNACTKKQSSKGELIFCRPSH